MQQLQLCLCLLWHHMALSWMSHPAGASADSLAHVLLLAVMLILNADMSSSAFVPRC